MSYGLKITNPSGQLVLSSDAKGLYCIGRAALQGSVVQPSGTATSGYPGRTMGYSVYRISHGGPIIPAIDLPLNMRVSIVSVSQPSSGVWDITAYCGDTADSNGFDVQYQVDVWAFGFPLSAPSGYGMLIRDAGGNIAYDLTRPHLLFPRAFVNFPSDNSGVTIPSLSRAVVIGAPCSYRRLQGHPGFNTWDLTQQRAAYMRTSATAASTKNVSERKFRVFGPEDPGWGDSELYDTPSFILEGSGFP